MSLTAIIFSLIILSMLLLTLNCYFVSKAVTLKTGQNAPDFRLQDENGKWHDLSEYKNEKLVLYFYPKDDTTSCRKEACSFRDFDREYKKHNITVLGISYDSQKTHKKFKEKYHLPFTLLSDTSKEVAKKYGAYTNMLNFFFPKRITFLIEDGKIKKIYKNFNVKTHAEEIYKDFSS